jgi:IS30 family transposase
VDHPDRKSGHRRKEAFGARQSGRSARVRYCALTAQAYCDRRARRRKPGKLAVNEALHDEVQARLLDEHSPEQIAQRLAMDFPDGS